MALIFMDGFDCYSSVTDAQNSGWIPESSTTISTTAGRAGGGALEFVSTIYQWTRTFPIIAYGGTIFVCFAYYHKGAAAPTQLVRVLSDTGGLIGAITHDTAGTVTWTPSTGGVTNTAGSPLTANSWHWVELKIVLGTTASNGSVEVQIDGASVLTATSQDTNTTGVGAGGIELTGGASTAPNQAWIDDIVIMDGTGSALNNFLGDCLISTLTPNADGGTVDWTASAGADYECVDEAPSAANDDTDYISSSTAGQESRFQMTNLTGSPASVHAVGVRYRAKKTDAGVRTLRSLINSNATEQTGTERGLTSNYIWRHDYYSQDPDGPSAWDEAAVNAMQVGVEVVQ